MLCGMLLRFRNSTSIESPTSARMTGPRIPSHSGCGLRTEKLASVYSINRVFFQRVWAPGLGNTLARQKIHLAGSVVPLNFLSRNVVVPCDARRPDCTHGYKKHCK